ncbi:STAS domain-containing protein [Bacillus sp. AK128]
MKKFQVQESVINYGNHRLLAELLLSNLEDSQEGLEVDLLCVDSIDSTGISIFVKLFHEAKDLKRKITLINVNEKILEVFYMTRLQTLFEIKSLETRNT